MFAIHVSTTVTDMITGFFLPVVIAMVTKSSATNFEKRLVLGICSAIAAIVSTLATTGNAIIGWASVLNLFLVGLMTIASYYGWWKGGTAFTALVTKTASIGVGRKAAVPPASSPKVATGDAGSVSFGMLVQLAYAAICVLVSGVVLLALASLLYGSYGP